MNSADKEYGFSALAGLVEAAASAKAIFPYVAANATRLKLEVDLFTEFARHQDTRPYERLLASSLQEGLGSGMQLDSLEKAKSYVSSLVVRDGRAPWVISMMQSLWHLRNDRAEQTGNQAFEDKLVVLVSVFNETRCCALALRSLRLYAGVPCHIVAVNNSTRDVSSFRDFAAQNGLIDEWLDTGVTHHGLGLQKAFERYKNCRYIALVDSDAIGFRENWLAEFVQLLNDGAALVGPIRDPGKDTVAAQVIHPCCMAIDQKAIAGAFQIDFRSFWPFWDVGGLLTWDCRAHGIKIAEVSHVYGAGGSTNSAIVNGSVRHLWYASRISDMEDEAMLDGHTVGDIRRRLENDLRDPSLDALRASPLAEEPGQRPLLSVVLTTYNRPELLKLVLEGFATQTCGPDIWEMVIVDDGSQPPAREIARSFADKIEISYIHQENSGLAAARNAGIAAARGGIILFHDDDDLPDANLVAEHIKSHQQNPDENVVVLGHLDWHPSLTVTPLMHYITHTGGQYFGYDNMVDGRFYPAWKWWGGLVSAKASLLASVQGPFDETFRFGHEDTELVCRLADRGIKVLYNAQAKKWILRPVMFDDFCQRRIRQGHAMHHLAGRHPDIVVPRYGLATAQEEYASRYEQNLQKWHSVLAEFEPAFNANPQAMIDGTDPATAELQKYWAHCFRGYMLKGYIEEAAQASGQQKSAGPLVTIPTQNRRIMIICPMLPRPDVGSSNVRVHRILEMLVEAGYGVEVLYFGQHEADRQYIASWGNQIATRHMGPKASELAGYIESAEPRPACIWMTNIWEPAYCEAMQKVGEWLKQTLPDIALVVDTMDHHAAKHRRQFAYSRSDRDADRTARFETSEAKLYPLADRVITVTEDEKQSIAAAVPGCSLAVIPNIHTMRQDNPGFEARRNICFIGSLGIPHNLDGVRWFVNEVFPLVRQRIPNAEFHIMGVSTSQHVQMFGQNPGVKIVGYVPDAEAAVAGYRVFVCPLVYGAGLKGKLGTAAASGTPFVTTTVGAQGFGLVNGAECFIVDKAAEFAAACMLLYTDKGLWEAFASGTKKRFEASYSPEAVAPKLRQLLDELIGTDVHETPAVSLTRKTTERVASLLQNRDPAQAMRGVVNG